MKTYISQNRWWFLFTVIGCPSAVVLFYLIFGVWPDPVLGMLIGMCLGGVGISLDMRRDF